MRSKLLAVAIVTACVLISACGGGGGGGSTSGGSVPDPSINVVLSASSGSASVIEGATITSFSTSATGTPSATITTPMVADVQFDKAVFASVTAVPGTTANSYTLTATTLPDLGGGDYTGNITLRLCQEAACTKVYAGSTVSYAYSLTVKLQDWATFQRNASHTGYVHVTLDVMKFTKAWEWKVLSNGNQYAAINAVVSGGGKVFVTRDGYFLNGAVQALDEQTGQVAWAVDIPDLYSAGSAALSNGKLVVPTLSAAYSQGNSYIFDASTGSYLYKGVFSAQWSNHLAPTPYGSSFYQAVGGGGWQVYNFNQLNGDTNWKTVLQGVSSAPGLETPAVDEKYVYYNTGYALTVLNRTDGSLNASITDPNATWNGYDYSGAPIIGKPGSVLSFSGLASTGLGLSSSHTLLARPLTRFDIASKSIVWSSERIYSNVPAYAKGVVYITKNDAPRLDAISEETGSVMWSWVPPLADTLFMRNIIVTDNLVFVSTDTNVYAIDINTHQKVWSYGAPGMIALSPGYNLYIATGKWQSDGGLVAIKLK